MLFGVFYLNEYLLTARESSHIVRLVMARAAASSGAASFQVITALHGQASQPVTVEAAISSLVKFVMRYLEMKSSRLTR